MEAFSAIHLLMTVAGLLASLGMYSFHDRGVRAVQSDRPELVLQTGHAEKVDGIAYSPDGLLLASGSSDSTIKLWDVALGRELRTLTGHQGAVKAVAFSPNGERLASGGNDGRVRIWDVASGREIKALPGHTSRINTIIFSSDGRYLASAGADKTIRLWEAATWRELRTFSEHKGWVLALAFSPDGEMLASGGADKTVRLWRTDRDDSPRTFTEHANAVLSVAFSADGSVLASGSTDGVIKLRKLVKGVKLPNLSRAEAPILSLGFSRDGATLTAASGDQIIRQFDISTGRERARISPGDELGRYETIAFSPDLSWMAACTGNRTVELRRLTSGNESRRFDSNANSVLAAAFSRDRRWFASGHDDNTVKLWDLSAGRQVRTLSGYQGKVSAVAFSPDGEMLAAGSVGGEVKLWNLAAGREADRTFTHAGGVNAIVFSPDGKWIITGSSDKSIRIWETATGRAIRVLNEHSNDVNALALSADGRRLISASADKTIRLWDPMTGKVERTLSGHTGAIYSLALSPDGRLLASGGADHIVRLWDLDAGREVRALPSHTNYVYALAFSPDGRLIASGGADRTIRLWDAATGREKSQLEGHVGTVNSLLFTPDGRMLASGSEDGSTRLWATETGAHLATLVSLRERPDWLVVTPDGLFDGSTAAWGQILWRFAQNTFKAVPVEVFFEEFFYPDLLADLLSDNKPRAKVDISKRDRRQPTVKIAPVGIENGRTDMRFATVRIEVSEAAPNGDDPRGSGAQDVRLFRNGSLVRIWRDDVLKGERTTTLEYTLPLIAGENHLTAYAFNRDDVKSADGTQILISTAAPRRGTLYLLAIGVSQYANTENNLKYAVEDARLFAEEVRVQQERLGSFEKVEVLTLFNQEATKDGILAAIQSLAGNVASSAEIASQSTPTSRTVQPEDTVVVFFAGHGAANPSLSERYYLIPHDFGKNDDRDAILPRSITDLDLEEVFEDIDAGHLLLIIDACNSGQAIEAKERRRGPMNSKGLAQLAYEKGMNILTASQNDQFAFETDKLGHGLLTWALIEEGLKKLSADDNPKDDEIVLREWLDFATSYVPRLRDETMKNARQLTQSRLEPRRIEAQLPRVFYRREPEISPFVIARRTSAAPK
jgi:WD40 repeat protein/uncharacterized caspase-like protein